MLSDPAQATFAELFDHYLHSHDTSIRRVARLSGVSRRTMENWLYGHSRGPRCRMTLLRVTRALHLQHRETNHLLRAAGLPALEGQGNPYAGV